MPAYHYQDTSLSLIYTPPLREQQDPSSDGREMHALERTKSGCEAGAAPGMASELITSWTGCPRRSCSSPFPSPFGRQSLRQHLGQNKAPAVKLRRRCCLSTKAVVPRSRVLNHAPSPPPLGWSPTQAIGPDICLARSSHNTEAWLRASVPRSALSEDFWITQIPGMGSN